MRPSRTIVALACLGLLGALVISAAPRSVVLFAGSFDGPPGLIPVPEFGQWAAAGGVAGMKLGPDGSGGHELILDDTAFNGLLDMYLLGTFEQGRAAGSGTVTFSFSMEFGQPDSPFLGGIVIDTPAADFIPATGPDDEGMITIAGKPTNQSVKTNVPYHVTATYRKPSAGEDWTYSITVEPQDAGSGPHASPQTFASTGTIPGSSRSGISAIAFVKDSGRIAVVSIDNVLVVQDE